MVSINLVALTIMIGPDSMNQDFRMEKMGPSKQDYTDFRVMISDTK